MRKRLENVRLVRKRLENVRRVKKTLGKCTASEKKTLEKCTASEKKTLEKCTANEKRRLKVYFEVGETPLERCTVSKTKFNYSATNPW